MTMNDSGTVALETTQHSVLLALLSNQLQRPVIDKTGLTGKYVIKLDWAHDIEPSSDNATANDTSGASLFTALQEQLGLKLMPAKGPVQTIVIDHVERPSEN